MEVLGVACGHLAVGGLLPIRESRKEWSIDRPETVSTSTAASRPNRYGDTAAAARSIATRPIDLSGGERVGYYRMGCEAPRFDYPAPGLGT